MVSPLLLSRSLAHSAGYRDIPVAAARQHLSELRLVDVREPDEFVGPLGHMLGAELVPLATVENAASRWDPEVPVLLICRSGARSGRAAAALAARGFRNVFNLTGGMLAWVEQFDRRVVEGG